jgi:hypothetical protein
MVTANHHEDCGVCHASPCSCAPPVVNPSQGADEAAVELAYQRITRSGLGSSTIRTELRGMFLTGRASAKAEQAPVVDVTSELCKCGCPKLWHVPHHAHTRLSAAFTATGQPTRHALFCGCFEFEAAEPTPSAPEVEPTKPRRFPVLNQQNCRPAERKAMPRHIPWEFAETFRAQAERNHGQTLERLAERGGLAPEEMWLAAHGCGLFRYTVHQDDAIAWLNSTAEPKPEPLQPSDADRYAELIATVRSGLLPGHHELGCSAHMALTELERRLRGDK